MITVKNYNKSTLAGFIDKYPAYTAMFSPVTKELRLRGKKPDNNEVFNSIEEFDEYVKNRKDDK
jgi:hypothetical protein